MCFKYRKIKEPVNLVQQKTQEGGRWWVQFIQRWNLISIYSSSIFFSMIKFKKGRGCLFHQFIIFYPSITLLTYCSTQLKHVLLEFISRGERTYVPTAQWAHISTFIFYINFFLSKIRPHVHKVPTPLRFFFFFFLNLRGVGQAKVKSFVHFEKSGPLFISYLYLSGLVCLLT